jgi:hypothetical protein
LTDKGPDAGIVFFEPRGVNQHGTLVLCCQRANLMRTRGAWREL